MPTEQEQGCSSAGVLWRISLLLGPEVLLEADEAYTLKCSSHPFEQNLVFTASEIFFRLSPQSVDGAWRIQVWSDACDLDGALISWRDSTEDPVICGFDCVAVDFGTWPRAPAF